MEHELQENKEIPLHRRRLWTQLDIIREVIRIQNDCQQNCDLILFSLNM